MFIPIASPVELVNRKYALRPAKAQNMSCKRANRLVLHTRNTAVQAIWKTSIYETKAGPPSKTPSGEVYEFFTTKYDNHA
jgi:hypothetical protein